MSTSAGLAAVLLALPVALSGAVALVVTAAPASAAVAVDLGTAASYAVLGATTVTSTGPTVISGDLGLSPGTSVTGFPPGTVINGTMHVTDAAAGQAQADTTTAYNTAAGLTTTGSITADLGGQVLGAGVYTGSTLALTGTLTLDGAGDPDAVFVFQSGSTLITAPTSVVALIGGASACNVFWQVTSSATLGVNSVFAGSVAALSAITANSGATVQGRLLARNAAVTLDTNTVTRPLCAAAVVPSPSATPTAGIVIPPAPSPAASATPTPSASPSASPVGSPSTVPATATPVAVPASPPVALAAPRRAPVVLVGEDTAAPPVGSTSIAVPQPAPVPMAPAAPGLPQTGAALDAAGPAGLLMLLLGGFALHAGRRPRSST